MRSGHHRLLRSAGFSDSIELDITPAFRATAAAWLAESEALRGTRHHAGLPRHRRRLAGRIRGPARQDGHSTTRSIQYPGVRVPVMLLLSSGVHDVDQICPPLAGPAGPRLHRV